MMDWAIFRELSDLIAPPVLTAAQSVADTLISAVSGPLKAALTVYVAVSGYGMLTGRMAEPVRDVWVRVAQGAFVVFLLTAAHYDTYVANLFMRGIPDDIAGAISGSAGTINAGIFDHIWNTAFKGGLEVWKNTSMWDVALELLIIAYWITAALACVLGFAIWQCAQILLGLFVAVGPLIGSMFLFSATRPVFERWIGALLSCLFLEILVVVLLVVLMTAENKLLAGLPLRGSNVIAQIQTLFAPVILFLLASFLIWQLPGAATALAGGMHLHAYGLHRAVFGRSMEAARAIGGRARATAAVGTDTPTGRAISSVVGRPLSVSGVRR